MAPRPQLLSFRAESTVLVGTQSRNLSFSANRREIPRLQPAKSTRAPLEMTKMLSLQQIPRGDHALHLAGACVNRDVGGVAVHALDVGFTRVAEAAVNLHRFVRDSIRHFAGVQLCLRRSAAHRFA